MRNRLLATFSVVALLAATFVPVVGTAHADPDSNPSTADCLGEERGIRNRNGGDREHGVFGPIQADFVKAQQPYGQWLQEWKEEFCND